MNNTDTKSECPICCKPFPSDEIEIHVNRCIFLNTKEENNDSSFKESKRNFSVFQSSSPKGGNKKPKLDVNSKKTATSGSSRQIEGTAKVQKKQTIEINDDFVPDIKAVSIPNRLVYVLQFYKYCFWE